MWFIIFYEAIRIHIIPSDGIIIGILSETMAPLDTTEVRACMGDDAIGMSKQ